MRAKKWVYLSIEIIIIMILFVFFFNYFIDPLGNREIVVKNKYKVIFDERIKKYQYIFLNKNYEKYNAYILGSSRIMSIDTQTKDENFKIYNFGVSWGNPNDFKFIIENLLKKRKIDILFIGFDFNSFYSPKDYTEKYKKSESSLIKMLSYDTTKYSIITLKAKYRKKISSKIDKNGVISYGEYEEMIKKGTYDFSDKKYLDKSLGILTSTYIDREYGLKINKQIKEICDKNKIKIIPFITPEHKFLYELYTKESIMREKYIQFKNDIFEIYGDYYDFSEINEINKENTNFYDAVHYRKNVAKNIKNKIFYNEGDYGKFINKIKLKKE